MGDFLDGFYIFDFRIWVNLGGYTMPKEIDLIIPQSVRERTHSK